MWAVKLGQSNSSASVARLHWMPRDCPLPGAAQWLLSGVGCGIWESSPKPPHPTVPFLHLSSNSTHLFFGSGHLSSHSKDGLGALLKDPLLMPCCYHQIPSGSCEDATSPSCTLLTDRGGGERGLTVTGPFWMFSGDSVSGPQTWARALWRQLTHCRREQPSHSH